MLKRLLILLVLLLLPSPLAAQVGNFSRVVLNGTVVSVGSGSPEASVTGNVGDVYIRTNGTIYTKTSGTGNTGWTLMASGGSGTVTSLGLTMPGIFSVSGTPVTTSGTIAAALATQSANRVWAGPTSGAAAQPTFRTIVFGDWASNSCATNQIPKFDGAAWVCGDDSGTGSPIGAQYLTLATDATLTNERVATAGTGITLTDAGAGSTLTIAADGANITSLSASNISSGTLAAARGGAGTANGILKANGSGVVSAATSGTDYAPATSGSLPLFGNGSGGFTNGTVQGNTTKVVTYAGSGPSTNDCAKFDANGNVTTAGSACGSGSGAGTVTHTGGALTLNKLALGAGTDDLKVVTATDGQIPIGKTSDGSVTLATITAGSNINVTNGAGSITIAASGSAAAVGLVGPLEQHTASTSSSLDFTTCISSTYDEYLIEFVNLLPTTNNQQLWMRAGTGGGPTYDSGNNYFTGGFDWNNVGTAVFGQNNGSKTAAIWLNDSGNIANTSGYGVNGFARLSSPGSANNKTVTFSVSYLNSNVMQSATGSGTHVSATAWTAFQFIPSGGGTWASGTIRCYGLAK